MVNISRKWPIFDNRQCSERATVTRGGIDFRVFSCYFQVFEVMLHGQSKGLICIGGLLIVTGNNAVLVLSLTITFVTERTFILLLLCLSDDRHPFLSKQNSSKKLSVNKTLQ